MSQVRLQNVFYNVADMRRARQFYEMLLEPSVKFADGERWVQYTMPGGAFALGGPGEAHALMTGAAAVFEVDDLDSYGARLSEIGGRLLETRDMGSHGKTMVLADPDGNIVHLWSRTSGTTTRETP